VFTEAHQHGAAQRREDDFMPDRNLDRAADVALEAANATVVHLGRIAKLVSTALGRAAHEVADLVLIYQDLASEFSQTGRGGKRSDADADPAELRWRTTEYCVEPGYTDPHQHLN
jgi:hypothetical protein